VTQSSPLPIDPIAEAKRQWLDHGWTDAANGMALVTSIMRAQQLMLARVDNALKPFNLSFARYEMLTLLSFSREGALPMASATARLQVHPTSVSNTVARLERDGLVTRSAHPTDGRAMIVIMTEAGRKLVAEASRALNSVVFADPGISDPDLSEIVRVLARFREDSGDFTQPPPHPDPL
jgi:DNA-binding MarR family transcriptional regulator